MKKSVFYSLFLSAIILMSCSSVSKKDTHSLPGKLNDVTLCYYGGGQRKTNWDKEQCAANVFYTDSTGTSHWLFDTFLFLEFYDASIDRHFEMARLLISKESRDEHGCRQEEWQGWLDKTLKKGMPVHSLDAAIDDAIKVLGQPKYRRQVCLMIPIPIIGQTNWGSVNGKVLDFNNNEDRLTACKWYIEKALEMFKNENYKNVDFGGFYWIEEVMGSGKEILPVLNTLLKEKGIPLLWIPYYGDTDLSVEKYQTLGFNKEDVFLQPSYAFHLHLDYPYLESICRYAKSFDVSMELEFGESEIRNNPGYDERYKGRLSDYIRAYRAHDFILQRRLAYYQGSNGVQELKKSPQPQDQALFHELAGYISERQRFIGEK